MPFSANWQALMRESELAAEQIGSGVTALGRANHAASGFYTQAFFGLSIGLERLAKLAIVAAHAIENEGRFPDNQVLRKYGHDIRGLFAACEPLAAKYCAGEEHCGRPNDTVHQGIVLTLAEFAELSRYYNLDLLAGGKATRLPEPVGAWWQRVGTPILDRHYSPKRRERDRVQAEVMEEILGSVSMVVHHDEQGNAINSIEELSRRAGATAIVQRYGRLYTLQLARWLVEILAKLSFIGSGKMQIDDVMGLYEPFVLFRNDDDYFRNRKTWSIYRL
jgi:hypothetical protein